MPPKKHTLLSEISISLSGRSPETIAEVLGHKYTLRLLKPEAEEWAASNTVGTTQISMMLNSRTPTLACAITAIDNIPIETLFQLGDDVEAAIKEEMTTTPLAMRDWRRVQVLTWLREDGDREMVDLLYAAYAKLIPKHKEALKDLSNLSKGTPSEG